MIRTGFPIASSVNSYVHDDVIVLVSCYLSNLNQQPFKKAIKTEIKSGEDELLGSFQSLNVVGNSINDIVDKQVLQRDNYKAIADKVKLDLDNLKKTLADLNKTPTTAHGS